MKYRMLFTKKVVIVFSILCILAGGVALAGVVNAQTAKEMTAQDMMRHLFGFIRDAKNSSRFDWAAVIQRNREWLEDNRRKSIENQQKIRDTLESNRTKTQERLYKQRADLSAMRQRQMDLMSPLHHR